MSIFSFSGRFWPFFNTKTKIEMKVFGPIFRREFGEAISGSIEEDQIGEMNFTEGQNSRRDSILRQSGLNRD